MSQRIVQAPELVGIAQVMGAALLWGTVGVAAQLLPPPGSLSQQTLGFLRLAIGGPALFLLVLAVARRRLRGIRSVDPLGLAAFSTGCATFQICLFRAFDLLGVTVTVFLTVCLPPLISTALSLWRQDRGATPGVIGAFLLASIGLSIFALEGITSNGAAMPLEGLGFALLGSVAFVWMTSAARRLSGQADPLVVAGLGLSIAALLLLPAVAVTDPASLIPDAMPDARSIALVLYLGLFPTALAYVLYCKGISRCRSANLGLVASMVEPAFAALLAWLLLDERLTFGGVIACALVLLGMVTLWNGERRLAQSTAAKPRLVPMVQP